MLRRDIAKLDIVLYGELVWRYVGDKAAPLLQDICNMLHMQCANTQCRDQIASTTTSRVRVAINYRRRIHRRTQRTRWSAETQCIPKPVPRRRLVATNGARDNRPPITTLANRRVQMPTTCRTDDNNDISRIRCHKAGSADKRSREREIYWPRRPKIEAIDD